MNEEQRFICENLRTALNGLHTGSDGYSNDISQEGQWRLVSGLCYGILTDVFPDPADDDERAWRRVAQATWDLIASEKAGVRDPDVAEEWFAAKAAMPPMQPPEIRGEG